jgi:phosphatidylglycerophosphate synthase
MRLCPFDENEARGKYIGTSYRGTCTAEFRGAVSRPMSFQSALEELRAAQKPSYGTPAYSRLVNRPLARYVAAAVSTRRMTPNQATVISALLSGTAIVVLAAVPPRWWSGLLIGGLLMAGYVMDSVDGQLARLYGGGSKAGEWLDHTIDCAKTVSLHLAIAIAWFRFPPVDSEAILLVPLGYTVVASVMFFGLLLVPTLRPKEAPATVKSGWSTSEAWWRKYVLLFTDYGFLCLGFLFFGLTELFCGLYVALLALNAATLCLALRKWWRELLEIDRAPDQTESAG